MDATRYKRAQDTDDETQNQIGDTEDESAGNLDDNFDRVSKRFLSIFRTRPPKSEGYKRGPGFRSWGGKRSEQDSNQAMKRDTEYIMPFQQSQKRGKNEGAKRRPFQSWGGKRGLFDGNPTYFTRDGLRNILNWEEKRKFSSWGGKRGDDLDKRTQRRKPSFQSWGGKRADYE